MTFREGLHSLKVGGGTAGSEKRESMRKYGRRAFLIILAVIGAAYGMFRSWLQAILFPERGPVLMFTPTVTVIPRVWPGILKPGIYMPRSTALPENSAWAAMMRSTLFRRVGIMAGPGLSEHRISRISRILFFSFLSPVFPRPAWISIPAAELKDGEGGFLSAVCAVNFC